MTTEVLFTKLPTHLGELEYPITREDAATAFEDVTVLFADGEQNLGELIAATPSDRFDSATDLEADIHTVLPREAVGEPYQSEGDA